MKRLIFAALAAALAGGAQAGTGADLLKQQCISCHAVSKPAKQDLDHIWQRLGPDLHYAGDKFNRDWLVGWLQNPAQIRAGGVLYSKLVKASADQGADTIDESKLAPHPKLSAADAALAADALMALKTPGLVEQGAYKNLPPNMMMASMLFSKLRGCTSCHAAKPGGAPLSGPQLYDAGARLQPDYVVSYMRDPQKFDPHVWMPKLGLTEADVQKLAAYIATLKEKP